MKGTINHDSPFYEAPKEDESTVKNSWKADPNSIPTVVFHGMGDACINPGMMAFENMIRDGTGGEVKCIEVGAPSIGEVINNFETVAENSCSQVANDPIFKGEFNAVGLSQGGLLARFIVEECDMPGKVRNLVTIGGPNMGVDKVPQCFDGAFCDVINFVAKKLVYAGVVQNWLAPAGYFRDANNLAGYRMNSVFLPSLNNEKTAGKGAFSNLKTQRFSDLNGALLIKFSEDTMIYPKETAWFQTVDENDVVQPLNATDFYNKDYIGLKSLTEAGKVKFETFEGNHLQFSKTQVNEIIIPFLKQ